MAADGCRLFLLGRTEDRLRAACEQLDGVALPVVCDVADPDRVDAAFAEIGRHASRIDVLINNAGVFAPFFLADATNGQIASTIGANLLGPMYCSRAVLPLMDRSGQILAIGSETVVVTAAMLGAYQASRAGLERFMKTLDQELALRGIPVTLIRAGKMFGPDMGFMMEPDVARRFTEESLKLGIDNSKAAISAFDSVAELIPVLLNLPPDLHVPEIMLAGRHP